MPTTPTTIHTTTTNHICKHHKKSKHSSKLKKKTEQKKIFQDDRPPWVREKKWSSSKKTKKLKTILIPQPPIKDNIYFHLNISTTKKTWYLSARTPHAAVDLIHSIFSNFLERFRIQCSTMIPHRYVQDLWLLPWLDYREKHRWRYDVTSYFLSNCVLNVNAMV